MYRLQWEARARDEYLYWRERNKAVADRIDELLADMKLNPFSGIGKPEPLKGSLQRCWSRRITREHRITYVVSGNVITIARCRGHYD